MRKFSDLAWQQQFVLLWIIKFIRDNKRGSNKFRSSEILGFIKEEPGYVDANKNKDIERSLGGTLGALSKEGHIQKLISERDPLWQLKSDLGFEPKKLNRALGFITYWV